MTPHRPRRVLITGVSNPLGAEVARRLAPQVPWLFGCDVDDPVSANEDMDFVHADMRQSVIGKLVRRLRIDTVVHLAVIVDSGRGRRASHGTSVLGTMNVLAGCDGSDPRLQLLAEEDAAEAIALAALGKQEGAFNVAGDGVVLLSQAITIMGARSVPVLPPYAGWASRMAIRSTTGVRLPSHLAE